MIYVNYSSYDHLFQSRNELARLMAKRVNEIDVKLLLFALQKTTQFEDLLSQRYYDP